MSCVTVFVPPALRQFVSGKSYVSVEAETVRQALEAFAAESASLRGHLFDQNNELRRFVRVFIDGRPATNLSRQEEPVSEGAKMTILLAQAGG